jgi:DNA-binding protein HU-beta
MTKEEFITKVVEKTGFSKMAANTALKAITETITEILVSGDKIILPGFGTFSVSQRAKRKGMNPQTGKPITIPASIIPKFKPSSKLKEAVNR